jgi:hypothetical protein
VPARAKSRAAPTLNAAATARASTALSAIRRLLDKLAMTFDKLAMTFDMRNDTDQGQVNLNATRPMMEKRLNPAWEIIDAVSAPVR